MAASLCEALVKLLRAPPVYCAVVNRYAEPEASSYLGGLGYRELQGVPFTCYSSGGMGQPFPPSPQTRDKLLYYYAMDMASLYPVLALGMSPCDGVLDMCAAPGGKAFALLQVLRSEDGGALSLNDSSAGRVKRLREVVWKCVSRDVNYSIRITRRRGERWGDVGDEFDRVLVDAPCSSDRHNVEKWMAKGNKCWPSSETFGTLQENLVMSALHAVKPGGVVVYATCTMAPRENDAVVDGVLDTAQRHGYQVQTVPPLCEDLEESLFGDVQKTQFGKLIVPSQNSNIGPTYLSKLHLTKK